jgi:hypothetical protein
MNRAYLFMVVLARTWRKREETYEVWAFTEEGARRSVLKLLEENPLYCAVWGDAESKDSMKVQMWKPRLVEVGHTPRSILFDRRKNNAQRRA